MFSKIALSYENNFVLNKLTVRRKSTGKQLLCRSVNHNSNTAQAYDYVQCRTLFFALNAEKAVNKFMNRHESV